MTEKISQPTKISCNISQSERCYVDNQQTWFANHFVSVISVDTLIIGPDNPSVNVMFHVRPGIVTNDIFFSRTKFLLNVTLFFNS